MESESRSKLSLYRKDEQWDSIVEHRELYSISWDKPFVVQSLSPVQLFVTPHMPGFPVLHHLPELAQTHEQTPRACSNSLSTESVMPSNHLILCCPLLPSILPSISLFQRVSSSHQVAKVLKLQLQHSISVSNEYSGLIFFRIYWFDLLALQGTLKSLLQHSLKASILCCSAFYMVQFSRLDKP